MNYNELKKHFTAYRLGKITRREVEFAIGLWQLKEFGEVAK